MAQIVATPKTKLRWWQCSLRSLLIFMTLVCVVSSEYAWRLSRQRSLERSVERFCALLDEQRFVEAEIVAYQAREGFPSPLTDYMVDKATFARQIAFNQLEPGEDGNYICMLPEPNDPNLVDDPAWQFGDLKEWEKLTLKRKGWLRSRSAATLR